MPRKKSIDKLHPRPVQLPSGSWRCQVMVKGKRISVVEDTPDAANAKALAIKAGLIAESKAGPAMTVGEAARRYIESKDAVLSPSTINGYQKTIKYYFPGISGVRLCDLTPETVQRWVNGLAAEKAPKTVRNSYGLLTAVVDMYAPGITLRATMPRKNAQTISVPEPDEIEAIMEACAGTEMELPILLAMWLGLRASEIRGLRYTDISDGHIHICRAIVDGPDGPAVKQPKTAAGDRWIKLPDYVAGLIDRQPKNGDYIVRLTGRGMYKRFSTICKNAGIKHYRFHDLRHTAASVSALVGVPTKYSQQRMGHATDKMLKQVYEHTMESQVDVFAGLIDDFFVARIK